MYPVAFVRIILGYQSISTVVTRINNGYLQHPHISERLNLSMGGEGSGLYFEIFKSLIQSQWLVMTYVLILFEILIGVSYILGFAVRIASLLGMLLTLHIYFFFEFQTSPGQVFLFYIHLLFFMLGAGRCLGLDYYFFKSRRGLLW
jgi:thiosulfate dehydrogenase [quinone] large subunit